MNKIRRMGKTIRSVPFDTLCDIVQGLAQGKKYGEVGRELGISEASVTQYVHNHLPELRVRGFELSVQDRAKIWLVKNQINPSVRYAKPPAGCRYYVAKERAECGKSVKGGQYCEAHNIATLPIATRSILSQLVP